jgi:carbon monoxide dehydrogenase subunit G
MKVSGSANVAAPLPRVWDALQDPAVLARTIPGCQTLEALGADTYKMTITAGVASIKGTYVGQVALADPEPPHSFVLRAQGQGAPGTVAATVTVNLTEDTGGTRVDYDADAVVGGMIGGVGQRMLGSVARKTAGEFFAAVERALSEAPAAWPAEAAPPTDAARPVGTAAERDVVGTVFAGRPAAPRGGGEGSLAWAMAAGFSAGGFVALAGVALGYLLGRRARR